MTEAEKPGSEEQGDSQQSAVVVDARQIFGDRREVVIEHEGVRYRLRITRRNKLILQK